MAYQVPSPEKRMEGAPLELGVWPTISPVFPSTPLVESQHRPGNTEDSQPPLELYCLQNNGSSWKEQNHDAYSREYRGEARLALKYLKITD